MFQSQLAGIFIMHSNSKGTILTACQMSFSGMNNAEIAEHFDVSGSTVSRWRKNPVWIDFENELVATYKEVTKEQLLHIAGAKARA